MILPFLNNLHNGDLLSVKYFCYIVYFKKVFFNTTTSFIFVYFKNATKEWAFLEIIIANRPL